MMTWAQVDFGHPEAEDDHSALERSFYEADSWRNISSKSGTPFIIGRKGAGKSAIAARYEIITKQTGTQCFIRFVPADFRHVEIRDLLATLVSKSTSWQYIYRKVWEGILLGQIVRHFCECNGGHHHKAISPALSREIVKFRTHCGFYVAALGDALSDIISTYVRDVAKKTDALSQVELRKMLEPYDWKSLTTALHDHFANAAGSSAQILIAIDGLDEHWDTSEPSLFFLAELLMVTKVFTAKWGASIRFVICLRDNIFRALIDTKSIEYDKIESLIVSLEWTPHSLFELIARRVSPTKKIENAVRELKDLLPETINETNIEEYLGRNILQRPRDYINYFKMLQNKCGTHPRAAEGHVEDTIATYTANRLIDLENEFGQIYPGITKCITALHSLQDIFPKEVLLAQLNDLCLRPSFRSEVPNLMANYGQPLVLARILMSIGVVGTYNPETHIVRFVHEFSESRVTALWDSCDTLGFHPVYRSKRTNQRNLFESSHATPRLEIKPLEKPAPAVITNPTDYLPSKDSIEDLEKNTHKMTRKCSDLIAALTAIDRGQAHFRRFEEWVRDVISLCFIGDVLNAEEQVATADGTKRFEILFDIIGSQPPWQEIKEKFKTHRLLVECKNTDDPTDADFNKLMRDMNSLDVHVAILAYRGLSREPSAKMLKYQRAAYQNSLKQDVIITLSEVFLRQCLEKESNVKCRKNLNTLWRDHTQRYLPV